MKNVVLEVSISKNKKLYLNIDRDTRFLLKSKTYQKEILKKYKSIVNDNVKLLNIHIPQVYSLYRQFYFHLNDSTINIINRNFEDINYRFQYIFKNYSSGNQNQFTFSNIERVLSILIDTLSLLKDYSQKHKIYVLKHQCNPLLKMLVAFELNHYREKSSLDINDAYQNIKPLKLIKSESA